MDYQLAAFLLFWLQSLLQRSYDNHLPGKAEMLATSTWPKGRSSVGWHDLLMCCMWRQAAKSEEQVGSLQKKLGEDARRQAEQQTLLSQQAGPDQLLHLVIGTEFLHRVHALTQKFH